MIYRSDDYAFSHPIWVTHAYRKLPEGTVTTDTLIYEFDKPK
jgi:hypothetical protein